MSMDKVMKVFSSDGRIYQVEYAYKAVAMHGQTSIAIRGTDSVVVCTQKKVPDKLIVPDSVTNIFNVADDIGAVCVGNMQDAKSLIIWLRSQASEFKFKYTYPCPVKVLAQKLANFQQKNSQNVGIRPFCCVITLVGCDEEFGPQCYKVDPSGQSVGYKAIATGTKEQAAVTQLEKQYKKNEGQWNSKETVETAIKVLQAVISSDFKADEIEVGFASVDKPRFRKLSVQEIDTVLNEMNDAL